ncbi:PaaI family thioesterase [Pseudomonas mandelii]|uniref:PaaI family thioesterase n=1 Tax=Pseudomonas mandelii TaxID=75612 RepID=UPI00224A635B|nr:PaaI family thioesterase [Pseudomonas mandelii]MCX2901051.1 PaaI family thioesterase [Pseudomonas mandelii]
MHPDSLFLAVVNGERHLSNAADLLGWKFIRYDEGDAYIEFEASGALTNPMGNIQGGMLSAMLDDCMGPAVYLTLPSDQVAVTVEAQTRFLRAVKPGRIYGLGRIDHADGKRCYTWGQLTNEANEVVATATAIYQVVTLGKKP